VIPDPVNYIAGFFYLPQTGLAEVPYQASEVAWLRYPNPLDEFAPLSPLAPARLAADYASAAMRSNKNLFDNGIQMGGMVAPHSGQTFTEGQAEDIEDTLARNFKGVNRAHRWSVFRFDAEIKPVGFNPKEAEFLGGLKLALEDIARSYKVPLDLVGGQRTYENVNAAMKAVWTNCILPEARFVAADITEQIVRLFPGEADMAEFDASGVEVLQEEAAKAWTMTSDQIAKGALTVNEWRASKGLEHVPWGYVWWAPASLLPVSMGESPAAATQPAAASPAAEQPTPNTKSVVGNRADAGAGAEVFGSAEHERLWNRFVRRAGRYEQQVTRVTVALLERQRDSVLDRLRERAARSPDGRSPSSALEAPFDQARWIREFRQTIRPVVVAITEQAAAEALDDLALTLTFNIAEPAVVRFLERRAQRFAQRVNETTWERLKSSLHEGIGAGENIPQLEERVLSVMADRIKSTPETIARTEVIGAMNGGTLEAWRQSDVVKTKTWLAALDERTRETHMLAHGQIVALDEDFVVGTGRGPAPGQMGVAEEDINCRCSMKAGIE
jgi:SPP1 gp7 family putative phage head morphogenesis protein